MHFCVNTALHFTWLNEIFDFISQINEKGARTNGVDYPRLHSTHFFTNLRVAYVTTLKIIVI